MSTDILLDDVTCPGGKLVGIEYRKKWVEHEYVRSDTNHITELGLGITRFTVKGACETSAQRDALEAKCVQTGVKYLYFSSVIGAEQDRYFLVQTSGLREDPRTATFYGYEFDCAAADPIPYVTATASHVWS